MAKFDFLDWDSIREAEGFKVGDSVRSRGPHVGIIRNLISTKGRMIARVYWPTIAFKSEEYVSPGSEQFVDLDCLEPSSGEQLGLFESPPNQL